MRRRILVPQRCQVVRRHDNVPATIGLGQLTLVHRFTINDHLYGVQVDEYTEDALDANEYTVIVALRGGVRLSAHEYDFSD